MYWCLFEKTKNKQKEAYFLIKKDHNEKVTRSFKFVYFWAKKNIMSFFCELKWMIQSPVLLDWFNLLCHCNISNIFSCVIESNLVKHKVSFSVILDLTKKMSICWPKFSTARSAYPWGSLVNGDEQLDRPNCQTLRHASA